jgi:hypothetical protein
VAGRSLTYADFVLFELLGVFVCVCVCARALACMRACVCVCVRERERERGRERERERERVVRKSVRPTEIWDSSSYLR